jgi:hypothetical protein
VAMVAGLCWDDADGEGAGGEEVRCLFLA